MIPADDMYSYRENAASFRPPQFGLTLILVVVSAASTAVFAITLFYRQQRMLRAC